MLLEEELSSLIRCNGVTTLKKKPRGKQKIICELTFQSFFLLTEEEICTYSEEEICTYSEVDIYTYSVKEMLCNFWKDKGLVPNSQVLQKSIYGKACWEQPEEKTFKSSSFS